MDIHHYAKVHNLKMTCIDIGQYYHSIHGPTLYAANLTQRGLHLIGALLLLVYCYHVVFSQ